MSPYNGNNGNQNPNGQRRPPSAGTPADRYEAQRKAQNELRAYRPSVREVRPTRPYSYNKARGGYSSLSTPRGRRHRRPTPFVIIIIIFVIALLAVILTSKSFKRFIDSVLPEETETADTVEDTEPPTDTEPPITETEPIESDTMPPPEDDEFLICIDPGHGFGDIGSSHDNLGDITERDINLSVAKKVYDYLFDAGYNVIMSHDGEEFPISPDDDGDELYYIDERVSYANYKKVDLFVSIHCDTFPSDDSVSGTRIYYCTEYKYSEDAEKLSDLIKASINDTFPKYKEARTFPKDIGSAFYVTAYTDAPSALIELGFISSPDDAANLTNEEWQGEMAYAISNAVSVYINQNTDESTDTSE